MRAWLLVLAILACADAGAHEMRPAYLVVAQGPEGLTHFEFRQPADPSRPWLAAESSCQRLTGQAAARSRDSLVQRWQARCEPGEAFVISVIGLPAATIDVLIDFTGADGSVSNFIMRPEQPTIRIGPKQTPQLPIYLELGISHLLTGYDHLLFVIGLLLLVRNGWMLVKTVTSFTVAHSVTLALAALGVVTPPQRPVEAAIALSIIYIAYEITVRHKDNTGIRYPWQIAFVFGLLHGLGFAGVLQEIGLPSDQVASALLLFNLGIEVGQLFVIGAILALTWLAQRAMPAVARTVPVALASAYVIGSTGVYWLLERVSGL